MIIHGDCLEEMRKMEPNSISAIVTDPPYGLHFMGKGWDKFNKSNFNEQCNHKVVKRTGEKHPEKLRNIRSIYTGNSVAGTYDETRNDEFQFFIEQFGIEALRIIKPGGHILMFGAPRRYHRQVCGLEDAGFEIRDCLMWIFGSGFPKSHNHFGIQGYGTALKPAYEPIIMAMKPCEGTFKQNAEKYGQAGINIDGCRIGTHDYSQEEWTKKGLSRPTSNTYGQHNGSDTELPKGRWPANVIFDVEAAEMLDEQSGGSKSNKNESSDNRIRNCVFGGGTAKGGVHNELNSYNDSGGASRFFYCAKASSSERNEGLEGLPLQSNMRVNGPRESEEAKFETKVKNNHPTVKPLKLMEYLIKLVMPPHAQKTQITQQKCQGLESAGQKLDVPEEIKGPTLLDPFAGSGTTILAARKLGYTAIGIEKEQEYCEIARKRIEAVA